MGLRQLHRAWLMSRRLNKLSPFLPSGNAAQAPVAVANMARACADETLLTLEDGLQALRAHPAGLR